MYEEQNSSVSIDYIFRIQLLHLLEESGLNPLVKLAFLTQYRF